MSEPAKTEMAYWFYELCKHDQGELTERSQLMRQAICRLIESSDKGPVVDEAFVKKWAGRISVRDYDPGLAEPAKKQIESMLREAGVEVEE